MLSEKFLHDPLFTGFPCSSSESQAIATTVASVLIQIQTSTVSRTSFRATEEETMIPLKALIVLPLGSPTTRASAQKQYWCDSREHSWSIYGYVSFYSVWQLLVLFQVILGWDYLWPVGLQDLWTSGIPSSFRLRPCPSFLPVPISLQGHFCNKKSTPYYSWEQ